MPTEPSRITNERLSRMRAQAVRNYLVRKRGSRFSKLVIEGMGENSPINTADPLRCPLARD